MGKTRWTDEDQEMAERMRAFGSSYAEIGRALGFSENMVSLRLNPERYEKEKVKYRLWHQNNPEKSKACRDAFKARNPDYEREYKAKWNRRKKQSPF